MESYVLEWMSSKVAVRRNQYGGVKGCGAAPFLIDVWQRICGDLEDSRAASLLLSADYAKAFNRLSYQECLRALAKKWASSPALRLVATFLTNRRRMVRVGQSWSDPLEVHGGAPQGSCFLTAPLTIWRAALGMSAVDPPLRARLLPRSHPSRTGRFGPMVRRARCLRLWESLQ